MALRDLGSLRMDALPANTFSVTRMRRSKHSSPLQMLAKANRERLAVLLEEARSGAGGDERYAASLR